MDHKKDQPTVNLNLGAAPTQKMIPDPPSPTKSVPKQQSMLDTNINLIEHLDSMGQTQQMDKIKRNELPSQEVNPLMTHQYRKPGNAMLQKR